MRPRPGLVTLALLFVSSSAAGHTVGLSTGEYSARPEGLRAKLSLARSEAAAIVPSLDENHDGHVTALEIEAAKGELAAKIFAGIHVSALQPCLASLGSAGLSEQDGLTLEGRFACADGGSLTLDVAPFLKALGPGHRHLVRVLGATMHDEVLDADHPTLSIARAEAEPLAPVAAVADTTTWSFFRLGIAHILAGYDHLLFLFALLLVPARPRDLALVITAFTVGHSITLALAVLGVFAPGAGLVEPAIALSIAYVGVENLRGKTARRWRITLPFGMIHGFGFAGALRQVGLPRPSLPAALATFNLGVEAGQLLALAALLPLVMLARLIPGLSRRGERVASVAVVVAGLVWMVARLA